MKINYRLKADIITRAATQLNFELNKIEQPIYIYKGDRMINAKSLIGLLSGEFRKDDEVIIEFTNEEYEEKIKKLFDEIESKI